METTKEELVELIGMADLLEAKLADLEMNSSAADARSISNSLRYKLNRICGEEYLETLRNTPTMEITNIIGKGKAFEPPFRVKNNTVHGVSELVDKSGSIAIMMTRDNDDEIMLADHICDLLNREHLNRPTI